MKTKVFVTGSAGFIGRNLVERLAVDHEVSVLVRADAAGMFPNSVEIIKGDIGEPKTFSGALKGCNVVYHCAGFVSFQKKDRDLAQHINVTGARHVFEAALNAGVRKVVHLSSGAVLGFSPRPDKMINETADPEISPDNIYAYTKREAERAASEYVRRGLDISMANIATVYGAGDHKMNSGTIIKSIYSGGMKVVPPGGTSYVAVQNLVDGLLLLAQKGRKGERYIFAQENLSYLDLANRIAQALGKKSARYRLPRCSRIFLEMLAGLSGILRSKDNGKVNLLTPQIIRESFGYKYFDSSKARNELGWKPRVTLESAVQEALAFYLKKGLIPHG